MGFVHYSLRISEFISNVELLHRDSPKNNFEVFELFEIQHGYVSLRIKKPSQLSNIYATGTKKTIRGYSEELPLENVGNGMRYGILVLMSQRQPLSLPGHFHLGAVCPITPSIKEEILNTFNTPTLQNT